MITITSCKQEHTKAYKALCELVMPCRVLCISVGQIYDLSAETIDGLVGETFKVSTCVEVFKRL